MKIDVLEEIRDKGPGTRDKECNTARDKGQGTRDEEQPLSS